MSAEIFNIRDYQKKQAVERMHGALQELQHDCAARGNWAEALKYQNARAAMEFNAQPDFSSAGRYHAPDEDAS